MLTIKYAPNGDTLYTKEHYSILFPDLDYLVPVQIRQKNNGDFSILIAHESVLFEDFDISLLTTNEGFNMIDHQVYGSSPKQEIAMSLTLSDGDGVIIGGDRDNANQVTSNFSYQTLIIKTGENGVVEWEYISPSERLQGSAVSMVCADDGGLIVAANIGVEEMPNPSLS